MRSCHGRVRFRAGKGRVHTCPWADSDPFAAPAAVGWPNRCPTGWAAGRPDGESRSGWPTRTTQLATEPTPASAVLNAGRHRGQPNWRGSHQLAVGPAEVKPPGAIPPLRPVWQAAPDARRSGLAGPAGRPGPHPRGRPRPGWSGPARRAPMPATARPGGGPRRRRHHAQQEVPVNADVDDGGLPAILAVAAAAGYLGCCCGFFEERPAWQPRSTSASMFVEQVSAGGGRSRSPRQPAGAKVAPSRARVPVSTRAVSSAAG
jgi:hypothetical protein